MKEIMTKCAAHLAAESIARKLASGVYADLEQAVAAIRSGCSPQMSPELLPNEEKPSNILMQKVAESLPVVVGGVMTMVVILATRIQKCKWMREGVLDIEFGDANPEVGV